MTDQICPKCKSKNSFSKFKWTKEGLTELCRDCGFERLMEKQNKIKGGMK